MFVHLQRNGVWRITMFLSIAELSTCGVQELLKTVNNWNKSIWGCSHRYTGICFVPAPNRVSNMCWQQYYLRDQQKNNLKHPSTFKIPAWLSSKLEVFRSLWRIQLSCRWRTPRNSWIIRVFTSPVERVNGWELELCNCSQHHSTQAKYTSGTKLSLSELIINRCWVTGKKTNLNLNYNEPCKK